MQVRVLSPALLLTAETAGLMVVLVQAPEPVKEPFEQQLQRVLPLLLYLARQFVHDADDAQDLVQDTVERALRGYSRFDGFNFRAWICCIMRHHFFNSRRRRRWDGGALTEDPVVDDPGPGVIEMDELLGCLKPVYSSAMRLVDVEGYSYAEAAAALGVPEGTIMSRLFRARKALREELGVADAAAA